MIDPRRGVREVLGRIAASHFVVGSSLHAIVVAESLGIPARLVSSTVEPDFKYRDYYAGTGRAGFTAAATVTEAIRMGGERPPVWDRDALLDAFPSDLWLPPVRQRTGPVDGARPAAVDKPAGARMIDAAILVVGVLGSLALIAAAVFDRPRVAIAIGMGFLFVVPVELTNFSAVSVQGVAQSHPEISTFAVTTCVFAVMALRFGDRQRLPVPLVLFVVYLAVGMLAMWDTSPLEWSGVAQYLLAPAGWLAGTFLVNFARQSLAQARFLVLALLAAISVQTFVGLLQISGVNLHRLTPAAELLLDWRVPRDVEQPEHAGRGRVHRAGDLPAVQPARERVHRAQQRGGHRAVLPAVLVLRWPGQLHRRARGGVVVGGAVAAERRRDLSSGVSDDGGRLRRRCLPHAQRAFPGGPDGWVQAFPGGQCVGRAAAVRLAGHGAQRLPDGAGPHRSDERWCPSGAQRVPAGADRTRCGGRGAAVPAVGAHGGPGLRQ